MLKVNSIVICKYLLVDQASDSDGWVPADFEIQMIGRSTETYSLDDNSQEDENNFPCSDDDSECML